MLLYDNRSRLRLLLQLYGSIYQSSWRFFLFIIVYTVGLLMLRQYWPEYLPKVDHPYAAQSFATLIGFSVCFRTNIAWCRYWEACQEVTQMYSKWTDAKMQLQGFINSSRLTAKGENLRKLDWYDFEISHLFSVLSAVSVERLTRGDLRRMEMRTEKGVAWSEQVVFRERLRTKDLTGYRALIPMHIHRFDNMRGPSRLTSRLSVIQQEEPKRKWNSMKTTPTEMSMQLRELKAQWEVRVSVIGDLSKEEYLLVGRAKDRVGLVLLWLNELVTNLQPLLLVPPPILSRVYQELSNGGLGYSQAEKLSDIPFPFIFAQLLTVSVTFMSIVTPLAFTVVTGGSWITPVMASGAVLSFWCLNEIAKELENPFGSDLDDLPLLDCHERFVDLLRAQHFERLPQDRACGLLHTDLRTISSKIRNKNSIYTNPDFVTKREAHPKRGTRRSSTKIEVDAEQSRDIYIVQRGVSPQARSSIMGD